MEERFLFLLLLLRQPRLRMVYVTSMPVDPTIVEYYLALLPGRHPEPRPGPAVAGVGRRLDAAAADREAARAPSAARSDMRALIPDRARSHLVPYTTTTLERDLALALGIPMYGADPRHFPLGTKTGCRRTLRGGGVRSTRGRTRTCGPADDVVAALASLRAGVRRRRRRSSS